MNQEYYLVCKTCDKKFTRECSTDSSLYHQALHHFTKTLHDDFVHYPSKEVRKINGSMGDDT